PRDPRRRQPPRRRAIRPRRRARLRALRRASRRGGGGTERRAADRRPSGPGRRARRRLRAGRIHRFRGAEDRSASPAGALGIRRRAPRAAGGDRGSLRPATGTGREPLPHPGGEAEARGSGRRLLRLSRRPRERGPSRPRLGRAPGAPQSRLDRRLHRREPGDHAPRGGLPAGAPIGRCYTRRAPSSVSATAADGAFSMKRHISLVILSLALGLLVAACGGGGQTATLKSGDIAVVGGQTITKDEFTTLLNVGKKNYESQKTPFPKPGTPAYESLKGQLITALVQRAEFAQKAEDMGIHISDKQIGDRIQQLKKSPQYGGSEKKYEQTLRKQGLTPATARNEIKTQLISEALYNKVTGSVKVSDKAVTDYYNLHKSLYLQPATRDVRHILVNSRA